MPVDEHTRKEFESWSKPLPTSEGHGTDEDIRANLKRLQPTGWYLQGNNLIADTEMGRLVQVISPEYICKGVDEEGLPILEKIVLKS